MDWKLVKKWFKNLQKLEMAGDYVIALMDLKYLVLVRTIHQSEVASWEIMVCNLGKSLPNLTQSSWL
jgi:hypothetical protein